jgi:putative oxidoreductase
MDRIYRRDWTQAQSLGLLALRLVVGAAFIVHGWPKIQNPLHWMGDKVSPFLQLCSALAEFGGGVALILGFLTPIVAAALAINMAFALMLVSFPQHQPFVGHGAGGSFELPLVYFGVMVALFATGPGAYSVDAMAGRSIRIPENAYGSGADEHARAA